MSLLLRSVKITKLYFRLGNTFLILPFRKFTLVIGGSATIYTFILGLQDEMDNLLCVTYNIFCSKNETFRTIRCLRINVSLWGCRMWTLNFIWTGCRNSSIVRTVHYYRHGPRKFSVIIIIIIIILLLLLLLQLSCHPLEVFTLVQTKQIRINIHKRNNTKTQYKQYKTQ
jgi:hypothetical protein